MGNLSLFTPSPQRCRATQEGEVFLQSPGTLLHWVCYRTVECQLRAPRRGPTVPWEALGRQSVVPSKEEPSSFFPSGEWSSTVAEILQLCL